jgi:hypothetical protein
MIKSKRMRSVGHVASMGRREMYIKFWWESLKERNNLKESDAGGTIILR